MTDQEINDRFDEVLRKIERVETSLLTEFHKWASPNEARQKRYSAELHEFELRLEDVETRLKTLEGRQ